MKPTKRRRAREPEISTIEDFIKSQAYEMGFSIKFTQFMHELSSLIYINAKWDAIKHIQKAQQPVLKPKGKRS